MGWWWIGGGWSVRFCVCLDAHSRSSEIEQGLLLSLVAIDQLLINSAYTLEDSPLFFWGFKKPQKEKV